MIIGLVGFAGSGKGTVADILVSKHNFTKLAFADAVKDATAAIFGWPRSLLEGDTEESRTWREKQDDWWSKKIGKSITPRNMLQLMGTEIGRDIIHSNIWIYAMEKRMELYSNVVIADVRFENEIDFIRRKGGFIVRVKRGPDPEWYNIAAMANDANHPMHQDSCIKMNDLGIHYSEWAWIGQQTNYVLHNEGSISMLEGDFSHALKVFTGPQKPAKIDI